MTGSFWVETHAIPTVYISRFSSYLNVTDIALKPKAGQGMNTAFLDAQNLAWKIHLVESGFAKRSTLNTYESERKSVAENLLSFDAKYASLFSKRQPSAGEVSQASESSRTEDEPNEFVELFKSSCEFTSGYGVAYGPNEFNWHTGHSAKSPLFNPKGNTLRPGRMLPPANLVRVVDANEVHLEEEIPVNGSFRIYLFAGDPAVTKKAVEHFATNLMKRRSFYKSFESADIGNKSYHERHNPHSRFFTLCTIFAACRTQIDLARLPQVLSRYSHHVYADTVPDPRVPDARAAAHAKMGFDPDKGGVVVVRPDGYVACSISLIEGTGTVDALNEYFTTFTTKPLGTPQVEARL